MKLLLVLSLVMLVTLGQSPSPSSSAALLDLANLQKHRLDDLVRVYTERNTDPGFLRRLGDATHDAVHEGHDDIALQVFARGQATAGGASCNSAQVLVAGAVAAGSTKGAPQPGGVPATCGDAALNGVAAVWFRVPTGARGTHYVSTCGTATAFDTQITVLEGSCGGALRCVKGGDDDKFCSASTTHSTVSWIADETKQYYVLVHGFKAEAGNFQLSFGAAGVNPQLKANHAAHSTERYRDEDGTPTSSFLVVRRDIPVDIVVTSAEAVAGFALVLNDDASPADGNYELPVPAISPVAQKLGYSFAEMWAMPVAKTGHSLTWRLRLPETSPVGQYGLKVIFTGGISIYMRVDMFVLFNPMSKADDVYMADPNDLREYAFNEYGALFKGSAKSPYWIPWAYDQFNMINLITTSNMLVGATLAQRRSPVFLTRRLSAKLNSRNKGVLAGRWDNNYEDGKAPGTWESSTDIMTLFTYGGTKARVDMSVRYGQCWVFAGIFTTAMRSLGIPARPITNFASAHEAAPYDQNLDFYYRDDPATGGLKLDDAMTKDSVWNYHVWNEGWFKRRDFPGGAADGWQALDATPQESSSGPAEAPFSTKVNQCGPASIARMAAGDMSGGYDADFVTSEVNGRSRQFSWSESEKRWRQIGVREDSNGLAQLTKGPDARCSSESFAGGKYTSICQVDLRQTGHYKRALPASSRADAPPSAAEVALSLGSERVPVFFKKLAGRVGSWFKAAKASMSTITTPGKVESSSEQSRDVVFTKSSPDHALVGQPMEFSLTAKAPSAAGFTGTVAISLKSVTYTGESLGVVASQQQPANLAAAGASATVKLTVPLQQYEKFLGKSNSFKVTFSARLSGGQNYAFEDIILVPPPKLTLTCPNNVRAGTRLTCRATFKNPLTVPLQNLKFLAHLTGHASNAVPEPIAAGLAPGATFSRTISLDARTPGNHALIAILSSSTLLDLETSTPVIVSGKAVRNPALDHKLANLKKEKKPKQTRAVP